jgi:hypothetical protein
MKALRPWIALAVVLVCGAAVSLRRSSLFPWTHALPGVVAHEWWWEFDYPTERFPDPAQQQNFFT